MSVTVAQLPSFADPALACALARLDLAALDALDFGVIGFDRDSVVQRYNRFESEAAGLPPARVLGRALFTTVAPCMNNALVAQRFADAASAGLPLDITIAYVLTLRMRPVKVRLRLAAMAAADLRFVLVERRA